MRDVDERKSAIGMCRMRKALTNPRIEANISDDYQPSSAEIDEALHAKKALLQYLRHGDVNKIAEPTYRKSLSAFSFGGTGFLLAPEQATRVLSCLVDPSDLGGLVDRVTISSGSLKYLIDNARMGFGAWACESSCFSNNPQPEISEVDVAADLLRVVELSYCAADDQRALANISAVADEFAKHNPPSKFQCVCGAETDDPLDAEFERIHRPHVFLSGLDRLTK